MKVVARYWCPSNAVADVLYASNCDNTSRDYKPSEEYLRSVSYAKDPLYLKHVNEELLKENRALRKELKNTEEQLNRVVAALNAKNVEVNEIPKFIRDNEEFRREIEELRNKNSELASRMVGYETRFSSCRDDIIVALNEFYNELEGGADNM